MAKKGENAIPVSLYPILTNVVSQTGTDNGGYLCPHLPDLILEALMLDVKGRTAVFEYAIRSSPGISRLWKAQEENLRCELVEVSPPNQ